MHWCLGDGAYNILRLTFEVVNDIYKRHKARSVLPIDSIGQMQGQHFIHAIPLRLPTIFAYSYNNRSSTCFGLTDYNGAAWWSHYSHFSLHKSCMREYMFDAAEEELTEEQKYVKKLTALRDFVFMKDRLDNMALDFCLHAGKTWYYGLDHC